MRATYLTAGAIGAVVVIWLASGQLDAPPEPPASSIAESNARVAALLEERPATSVRVATIHASKQSRVLTIRGRTQNKRSIVVQSQIEGLVVNRPVERGDRVAAGDLLCQISVEDRQARLKESQAGAEQAKLEYQGAVKLAKQGLQSDTAIAQSKAKLAASEARLKESELELARLNIVAPFDGVVEKVHMEVGQYVTLGSSCITLVDLDPMLLIGQVAENELPFIKQGQIATAILPKGVEVSGEVTFIANTAEQSTRTYSVEVHVDNHDFLIPSGVTAQIAIPVEALRAQKISPALLVLSDEGQMGVRTINADNIVVFHEVEMIKDEADGIWVTGLPDVTRVIVVGQQLVVAGETVTTTLEPLNLASGAKESEKTSL
ncbi:MAG: multidrug efflux system membrane fusion protein [Candidatus Azotimanducaceae bacterium]|jgi:multidrug efflux system membrane fusion protein